MAFPYTVEENFEAGTTGIFDTEVDTNTKLDIAHYSEIARFPGIAMPYRGAYCMRVDLSGGTADAYLQETGSMDISAAGTLWFRLMLWFGGAPVMANADEFAIMQLWSATNTVEGAININYTTANGYRLGVGENASAQYLPLTLNTWHTVELKALVDSGPNDGTLDMYLDGAAATQVASLDQGAITSVVFGTVGIDAGTTNGTVLIDDIIADDAQIYAPRRRFNEELVLTKSAHAFVGPGTLDNVTLLSGAGTDNVLTVYDTDIANTNDAEGFELQLKNTANNETVDPAGVPVEVTRGCYVSMSGTNPRAVVKIKRATGFGSDGAIRNYGLRRTPTLV